MKRIVTILIFATSAAGLFAPETVAAAGAGTPEQRTARLFGTLRQRPAESLAFLLDMPKGADLHNHLSGAVYAETFVHWAAARALCVNQTTFVLTSPPYNATAGLPEVSTALTDGTLFGQIIDSWSMRNWEKSGQNGHDHFFDTFGKFGLAGYGQTGAMLAEVLARAARGHVSYMELMLTPDSGASTALGLAGRLERRLRGHARRPYGPGDRLGCRAGEAEPARGGGAEGRVAQVRHPAGGSGMHGDRAVRLPGIARISVGTGIRADGDGLCAGQRSGLEGRRAQSGPAGGRIVVDAELRHAHADAEVPQAPLSRVRISRCTPANWRPASCRRRA